MTKGPNITYVYALENHYALKKKRSFVLQVKIPQEKNTLFTSSLCVKHLLSSTK